MDSENDAMVAAELTGVEGVGGATNMGGRVLDGEDKDDEEEVGGVVWVDPGLEGKGSPQGGLAKSAGGWPVYILVGGVVGGVVWCRRWCG